MFQRVTAYILILTMLSAGFTRLFIYAGFEMNQSYIASTLCINKAKPMMQCKGKCYLAKKLKQAEEKEKSEKESQKQRFLEGFLTQKTTLVYASSDIDISYPNAPDFLLPERAFAVFHPPQV